MKKNQYQAIWCLILATSPCFAQQNCERETGDALDLRSTEKNLLQMIFQSESLEDCPDSLGHLNLDLNYQNGSIPDQTFRSQFQSQSSTRSEADLTSISEFFGTGAEDTSSSMANQRSNRVVNGYSIVKGE